MSKASTVSVSHATGGPWTLLRHWSWATASASSSVGRPAEVDLEPCRAPSSGVAVGVEHLAEGVERLVHGDEPVGPVGVPRGRLGGDGRADERRDRVGQGPQPAAVHRDEAVVVDLLAGEQPADDVDALAQPLVADLLAGPLGAGDALVGRLTGAQGRPEPPGEHARQGRDPLGHDRGVVALPRGVDDAERQPGRRQGGAEEGPGEPGLPLALRPRREVVRAHRRGEAGPLGVLDVAQEPPRGDLFVGAVEADDRHAVLSTGPVLPGAAQRRTTERLSGSRGPPGRRRRPRRGGRWPRARRSWRARRRSRTAGR